MIYCEYCGLGLGQTPLSKFNHVCNNMLLAQIRHGEAQIANLEKIVRALVIDKLESTHEKKPDPTTCRWCGQHSCDCEKRANCTLKGTDIGHFFCGRRSCGCPNSSVCQCRIGPKTRERLYKCSSTDEIVQETANIIAEWLESGAWCVHARIDDIRDRVWGSK